MMERVAYCSCGQLTARVRGEPVRISVCHCLACQLRTGSVFGVQARFRKEDVAASGESRTFTREPDDGGTITFHFCPHCGATVYYETEGLEEYYGIPVGAFADPSFPAPRVTVYVDRKHPWVLLPPEIEHEA
ncbi:MAG: GFA family protein [Acidobacteriota bacterium]